MKLKHSGKPKTCKACEQSHITIPCEKCGHVLTGQYTEDGHTTCEHCGLKQFPGVAFAND